jgi:hypothetical protein
MMALQLKALGAVHGRGRCYPGGVAGQLIYPVEPGYLIQTPKEVWMIWQRDHLVRRVFRGGGASTSDKVSPRTWAGRPERHRLRAASSSTGGIGRHRSPVTIDLEPRDRQSMVLS